MRAAIRQILFGDMPFSPRRLFLAGEQGVWYDPSDFGSMFQDSAGTTPVTAVEQPVGRVLDKSGRDNHASQSTTTSRPILRNLYNLFTYTEDFTNVAWPTSLVTVTPNTFTAPDGTRTADTLASSGGYFYQQVSGLTANTSYTASIYLYAPTPITGLFIRFTNTSFVVIGSGINANVTAGWNKFTVTQDVGANTTVRFVIGGAGTFPNGTSVYAWGASLVPTNEASLPYQRVVTNTLGSGVYDTDLTKFKPYLFFDGSDDWLQTGNINFSATDKMSVFAGVTKLSDSQQRIIAELSATIASNNGSFLLSAPNSAAANYNFSSKGTSQVDNIVTTYAAPITNVITGLADIAAPINTIRVNQAATTLNTSQGTGNFGNYQLYIGRRGGTTLPFNGRIYSLIIRGALTNSPQLEQTERWVAAKTGVTL